MPLPIIAIVGRPNVGKSTLFNRLAGRRIAIVSDVPGTTRDRVSVDAEWRDRRFIIVDTGGINPSARLTLRPIRPLKPVQGQGRQAQGDAGFSDPFDKLRAGRLRTPSGQAGSGRMPAAALEGTPAELWEHVRAQTQRALDQADGIILVVDAAAGLMPHDRDAAEMVRRTGKPSVVAVNKADTPARGQAVHEFHALGAGAPLPVSAYHGIGIDDLMAGLMPDVPRQEEVEASRTPRVAIVGRPNVGKSALYNAIIGEERAIVSPVPGTTRDPIDTRVRFGERELTFIDTAGLRRRGKASVGLEKFSSLRAIQSIERCHVALIVLEAGEFVTAQDAHVGGFVDQAGRAALIVINKWDLAHGLSLTEAEAMRRVRDGLKFLPEAPVLFTSAVTGKGVERVPPKVLEVYDEFTRELPQEELNRVLAEAVSRRPPPAKGNRRVRITGIKQSRTAPPTLVLHTNAPELIHFSYRRYIANRLREAFGFTGSPLRLEFSTGAE